MAQRNGRDDRHWPTKAQIEHAGIERDSVEFVNGERRIDIRMLPLLAGDRLVALHLALWKSQSQIVNLRVIGATDRDKKTLAVFGVWSGRGAGARDFILRQQSQERRGIAILQIGPGSRIEFPIYHGRRR